MSSHLVLQFLGLPQIQLDEQPVVTDRRKAIGLLAYLAMNDLGRLPQRYSRESLSTLFWPEYDQAKAFTNLRRTIWEVHQAIGEKWLIAERESVHLNCEAHIDLDVAQFKDSLSRAHQHMDLPLRIFLLTDTVKLYRNHFLTGFSLKDASSFNEWAFAESEELRRQLADALNMLSEAYFALDQAEKAIPYARRLIALDPLNESAHRRLMEVYIQAGQHSAALKQYQTCEQILRKELNLDPQPETRAFYKKIRKGEIKPVHIDKQIEITVPKHNLPSQISTFIGREKEQAEILNLLEKNRFVTLAGVGGIGKTRLSLQVGQKVLNDFPNGVWFIPLDSLSNPALLPQTVASVFNIRESQNQPVFETLKYVLREKTALLILDNCEHLLDECAQLIRALLASCPNLKVLATSREILTLEGEATYYLSSLSFPEDDHNSLETLTEYEAIRLFTERATLALSSFTLKKEDAQFVVKICHKVDGIPLAIELAAAHVNILQVEEILKQLQDSFALLATDRRTALPRHQMMRASMDWSWALLSEAEQIFLQQLSVFAGGWTLESASAVCGSDILGLIRALVRKSLIVVDQREGPETRYRFHEIVRQYVHQKLIESSEEANNRTRHLKYFLRFSEQAESALRGPTQMDWYARLKDERDNIRIALEWANQIDIEAGLNLSGKLQGFWESTNISEGIHWLTEFLQRPQSKSYPLARAKALHAQANLLYWVQKLDLAYIAAQESLDLFRACGDVLGQIDSLLILAESYNIWNSEIKELQQQALDLSKSAGDQWRQAQALVALSWFGNDYSFRISLLEEAVALFKKVGDLELTIEHMILLGAYELWNGSPQSAQKWMNEAIEASQHSNKLLVKNGTGNIDGIIILSRQLRNRSWLAYTLQIFGRIAFACGNSEEAYASLQKSIEIGQEIGHRLVYFWSRTHLAYLMLHEGDITEARYHFMDAAQNFQNDKNVGGVVFSLEGMAGLYNVLEKHNIAVRLIGWADATRQEINDVRPPIEQAEVDKIIAACLARMGEAAFSDAYDEGQKMTLDEAVAYALQELH